MTARVGERVRVHEIIIGKHTESGRAGREGTVIALRITVEDVFTIVRFTNGEEQEFGSGDALLFSLEPIDTVLRHLKEDSS